MADYVKAACAMVRVGDRFVTLANGAPVPDNADAEHVELLRERGIVAEGEPVTGYVQPDGLKPLFDPDNMHTDGDGGGTSKSSTRPASKATDKAT